MTRMNPNSKGPNPNKREDDWLWHIRAPLTTAFPRDITLKRQKALSPKHYLTFCKLAAKNGGESAYVAVYSDMEWQNKLATALYYDIDGRNILLSSLFAQNLLEALSKYDPMILFTGGKGYHFYILIPPTKIADLRGAAKYVLDQMDGVEYERYIDPHGLGNWRAIARIPYTPHMRTGFKAYLIRRGGINEHSKELARILADKFGHEEPIRLSKEAEKGLIRENGIDLSGSIPPCMLLLIDRLYHARALTHEERFILASYLARAGFGDDEIHLIFSRAEDYNPRVTGYQVNYLRRRGMKVYRCRRLKEANLCPIQGHCEFYPSINLFLGDGGDEGDGEDQGQCQGQIQ